MSLGNDVAFSTLLGETLADIKRSDANSDDEIIFTLTDGRKFTMHHDQDCCESVTIESITGDLADLIGSPLTMAEEVVSNENPSDADMKRVDEYQENGCFTWTFYKLATVKGYVTIRWYGTSNGYYSEGVSFERAPTSGDAKEE